MVDFGHTGHADVTVRVVCVPGRPGATGGQVGQADVTVMVVAGTIMAGKAEMVMAGIPLDAEFDGMEWPEAPEPVGPAELVPLFVGKGGRVGIGLETEGTVLPLGAELVGIVPVGKTVVAFLMGNGADGVTMGGGKIPLEMAVPAELIRPLTAPVVKVRAARATLMVVKGMTIVEALNESGW